MFHYLRLAAPHLRGVASTDVASTIQRKQGPEGMRRIDSGAAEPTE